MQRLGTDVVRDCIDPNYWVQAWIKAVAEHEGKTNVVLADDVRFDNEAAAVRQMGGVVIGINSPEINNKVGFDLHASEAGIARDLISYAFPEVAFGLPFLVEVADIVIHRYINN